MMTPAEFYVRIRRSRDTVRTMLRECYQTYADRLRLGEMDKDLTDAVDELDKRQEQGK